MPRMSPGCTTLVHPPSVDDIRSQEKLVDIVVVHDVHEDTSSWANTQTGVHWLRDLLPRNVRMSRIITWTYNAVTDAFFDDDAPDKVQGLAETLVQELRAHRQLSGTLRRPIIFICHGLGGVIVKKSLVYASTRTAHKVAHLRDQYVSTFAILFFGTPHGKTSRANWVALERHSKRGGAMRRTISHAGDHFRVTDGGHVQVSQSVDKEFSPLVKQFHMFFFWESLPTDLGGVRSEYIVDSELATPKIDNTEAAGIHATHADMVKFSSPESSDYRTVAAALLTYCDKAPDIISHRWRHAEMALKQLRVGEAWELAGLGFDMHPEKPFELSDDTNIHRYFLPPRSTSSHFVGRSNAFKTLETCFFPERSAILPSSRKSYVLYGMGGSGKTQLSTEFAHRFRKRYFAVFTLHAASSETISDSFSRIAQLAGLNPTESSGRHFVEQLNDPWLFIIDSADDPRLDFSDILPCNTTAHILITTQNAVFREEGTLGSMELTGLEEDEALELLFSKAQAPRPWNITTVQSGIEIVQVLGCLAQAIIQAGNCVYRRVCTVEGYMKLHSEARAALRRRRPSEPRSKEENEASVLGVYSVFDQSLSRLMKRHSQSAQDASDLLNILSCFHSEHIPEAIFSRAIANCSDDHHGSHPRFSTARIGEGILQRLEPPKLLPSFLKESSSRIIDRYRINWAIGKLQSHSLITFDGRFLSMHPLIHAWARDRLAEPGRITWANIALNTIMAAVSLPPVGDSEKDANFHRVVLPHLELCLRASGNETPKPLAFYSRAGYHRRVLQVLFPTMLLIIRDQTINMTKCGWIYAEQGIFDKATQYLTAVRNTLIEVQGEDDNRTFDATLSLAGGYLGLDKLEKAIQVQREAVEI